MNEKIYEVKLVGSSPLLMHHDDIDAAEKLKVWRSAPANQKDRQTADDRSPAWTWISYLYRDEQAIGLPTDNIMKCLMEAGALVPVPGGRSGKTFKAQSQSGMQVREELWPLHIEGKPVMTKKLEALMTEKDFDKHREVAHSMGIDLFVKRAAVNGKKHIRVRPKFHQWEATGTVVVWDEKLTLTVVRDLFTLGGNYKGIGDWRPSSKQSPGPFGRFSATVRECGV